jgi:uncharacterized protein (DUF58 family)
VIPTRRLPAALLAVGLVVLPMGTWGAGVWVLGNVAVLVAVVVDVVLAVSPRRMDVQREVDPVLVIDTDARLRWVVTNPTRRRARVHLADALPESLRAVDRRARLVVPAGARVHADGTVRPARRGVHDLAAITVRSRGPLGLVDRQRTLPVHTRVRVHPAFPSRQETELRLHRALRLSEGVRTVRLRGQGTDFESLRDYTPDDETRRIDWAATARALRPIVRTYRAERNQHVLILLDHGRTMAGRMGRRPIDDRHDGPELLGRAPRLEHAMDAAMALTRIATGLGDRVGLVTFSDVVTGTLPPRGGNAQMTRLVQALADIEPELVEPDYRGAFGQALARYRRRALVVVLTDLAAGPVHESLAPALPLLGRRHLVLVAAPADPSVGSWAVDAPRDPTAAYRMAAAVEAEATRRRTARVLQTGGATVVDAVPTLLPGRIVDAYLDLKAAGAL